MVYKLTTEVTIGKVLLTAVNEVRITSSWKELGDTCTIKLPNLMGKLEKAFAPGMPVSVRLGYNGDNRLVFEGFVASVSPKIPFEITCEDGLYALKRKVLSAGKSWKSTTLSAVLKEILAGVDVGLSADIPAVELSPFRIEKGTTVAQALQKLKEDYLLCAYFRLGKLYVGLPYTEFLPANTEADRAAGRFVRVNFQGNVAGDNLTFKLATDTRVKAKAISILRSNKRIEVEVGDPDGEERTLHYYNITSEAALKKMAETDLANYKFDGYTGSVTLFGNALAIHSGTALVSDSRYPERAGKYLIEAVQTAFGTGGLRRELTLGKKV